MTETLLLGGLQKTTLIDYPQKVACTVFTVGCNFRCPFCHNRDLVTLTLFKKSKLKLLKEDEFFDFLKKRQGILDGVCITGGEPTIQEDLTQFIKKIKNLGFLVKLDTNGSKPEMLKKLIKEKLLDYIAMDLKGDLKNYQKFIGIKTKELKIGEAIKLILKSSLPFEFRTTIVPSLHNPINMSKLAKQLKKIIRETDLKEPKQMIQQLEYYLQPFQPQNCLDLSFLKIKPFSKTELKEILVAVKKIFPQTKLRGEEITNNPSF